MKAKPWMVIQKPSQLYTKKRTIEYNAEWEHRYTGEKNDCKMQKKIARIMYEWASFCREIMKGLIKF